MAASYLPNVPVARAWAAANLVIGATSADAVLTIAAVAGKKHVIRKIWWSYSATPSAGNGYLSVEDVAAAVRFDIRITAGGPGCIDFSDFPMQSAAANTATIITLNGAGASNVGTIFAIWDDVDA